MAKRVDFSQFNLDWSNAKEGTFSADEKETVICSNSEGTVVCSSEAQIITKLAKLYSDKLEVRVLYYTVQDDGNKLPTEVRVFIPKKRYFTLRSVKDSDTTEDDE